MRAILLVIIIAVIAIIGAIATGFLNISQTRDAQPPHVSATGNGVVAKGGQAPAFDVETGSVKIGSKETTVRVPAVQVERPGQNQAEAQTNNTM
ncbi:MAG TPA: hypothetical protein VM308_01200 [Sphingomicrobium sp.]|nr:hypothetical protein [Sphingomicrobium sp.]